MASAATHVAVASSFVQFFMTPSRAPVFNVPNLISPRLIPEFSVSPETLADWSET
jgi:hypothetical protein